MNTSLSDPSWNLPEEAVPFVREFVLEISRRLPSGLGCPPVFEPERVRDASGCLEACKDVLAWLDRAPEALGRTIEDLDEVFVSFLQVVQEIDAKLHRAVHHVRSWMEEELAFSRSIREILGRFEDSVNSPPVPSPAHHLLRQMIQRIEAKEGRDQAEARSLSAHFEQVQEDLRALRGRMAVVEGRTRRILDENLKDALTGLWNRRALEARLEEEVLRSRRYSSPLGLVVWDVDYLREINERHGHSAGDCVLQILAGRVLGLLRRSDYVARLGGDTFVTVLPGTSLAQACAVAAKIRSCIASQPADWAGGAIPVTVSAGASQLEADDSVEMLLQRTEHSLMRSRPAPALPFKDADPR